MSATVRQFEWFLALPFFGTGMKTDLFQSCRHCWVFQICWHIECNTLIVSSFKILKSSAGIPLPPLGFFIVQFSRSVISNSLWTQELQNTRPPCLSPTPGVHSNSCPSSRWCHPAISSSIIPFSSCTQSLPASESFPMTQLFAWKGQNTGVSALASFLPKNTQGWSPLEWTGWISLQSKGLTGVFSNTTVKKHQFFGAQLSSKSNSLIHTWPLEKP